MNRGAIFTRAFWRDYVLDLRRVGKDKRARKSFLLRNAFLLFLLAYIGYYVAIIRSLHDPGTEIGLAVVLVFIFAVVGAVRWSEYRERKQQLAADIASAPPEVVHRLQQTAFGLAGIAERALSEVWLLKNKVPEGSSVVARSIQIETLRQRGVWDERPLPVRDWLARPDGTWTEERIASVLVSAETLHSLLWALDLLPELRRLDQLVAPLDFEKLSRKLQQQAPGVRPVWDLRVERNAAQTYFLRCYAEKIHRGVIGAKSTEQAEAVSEWLGDLATDSSDLLAGTETIGEIDVTTLTQVGRAAACRYQILLIVMDLLDGKPSWQELEKIAYAPLLMAATGDFEDVEADAPSHG